jgi:capsular exopolysaccharide synthesis family protein
MVDDQLPTGSEGQPPRLPIRHVPAQGTLALRPGSTALDLFEDPKADDGEVDLLAYWQLLLKRRWLILGIAMSALAAALLITLLTPPVYRASATLQIDREAMQIVLVQGVTSTEASGGDDFLQTQYELLRSRALAERVADTLNLAGSPLLQAIAGHSWLNRAIESLRPQARGATASREAPNADAMRQASSLLQSRLSVEPLRNSRLVKVSFDSGNPNLSSRVANAFVEGFIAQKLEHKIDASSYAKKYLEDRLRQTKAKLEQSERDLVAFAQKESIVSTGEGPSLAAQNLSALNGQLAAAQGERIRAQARWDGLNSAGGTGLPADMLVDSLVRDLQQQRADLQRQYQQKLQVFKPDYPDMKQLQGQIDTVNKQITTETANMRSSVRAEYDSAMAQERLLKEQLSQLRTQTLDVDGRSIQYNILKREADTNRQLYDALLQRYKEIGVATDVGSNNVSIVDRALPPRGRFKPDLQWNLTIGLLFGALLGVVTAFLLEFIDQTLKTPQDIEQKLRVSVLGIIPRLKKTDNPLEALRDLRSAFSEAYRSVRTALQFTTDNGVPRVLLVTSANASEGKSTTAWSLARNFAQLGKSVLLIDGDLRNPSLHRLAGVRSEVGLSNLLAGAANFNEAVQATDDPRLKIVLAGPLPPNPAELLAGSKLISLLTVAAESYDQVIIDGPPVLGIADAPILANAAAGTLLVVEAGKTRIPTAQMAVKRLLSARARIIGAILSKYASGHGYGYGYGDYGSYAYGATPQLTRDRA